MIFYRSVNNPDGSNRSLTSIRVLVLIALAAYPAGALLRTFGPSAVTTEVAGFGLILLSLISAMALTGTRLNRVTGEERARLDEYERNLRAGALENAYQLFSALVLIAVIYLAIASDAGWWVPRGYEQWNGLFWGVFLWSTLLPTALLAFRLREAEDGEE